MGKAGSGRGGSGETADGWRALGTMFMYGPGIGTGIEINDDGWAH